MGVSRNEADSRASRGRRAWRLRPVGRNTGGGERVIAETRQRLARSGSSSTTPRTAGRREADLGADARDVAGEAEPEPRQPFELTRLAAADMVEKGWGRIVMVSSTAGQIGAPRMSAYSASKAGLLGLMRGAAQDLAPYGGTCNAVLPGWVRTEMAERSRHERPSGGRSPSTRSGRSGPPSTRRGASATRGGRRDDRLPRERGGSGINGQAITVALGGQW